MLSSLLECILEGSNAFDRVGVPLYRVAMLSTELDYLYIDLELLCTELECFLHGWNALDRVGTLSTELEYLCTGLECFLVCWTAF
jgi:hypothetical protein